MFLMSRCLSFQQLPKPEDLGIICFTSGTTGDLLHPFQRENRTLILVYVLYSVCSAGNPKGAMLTHENMVSNAAGVLKGFEVVMH